MPKKAKQHAKKIETALTEQGYFIQDNKQALEREDLMSGTQMDKMLNTLQSFKVPKKGADDDASAAPTISSSADLSALRTAARSLSASTEDSEPT